MAETTNFYGNAEYIANYFGLNIRTVRVALDRLVRLGLLKRDQKHYISTRESYNSPDGEANSAIRKNHSQTLDLAKSSLENDQITERDFISMTMAINPKKIPIAKRLIREFRDELCHLLEADEKTEVYKMNIQLFSLKGKGKKYV